MRAQFRIGSGLSWIAAWLLVFAATAISALWPHSDLTWWVSLLLVLPLIGLVYWRQDQKGYEDPYHGMGDGTPMGPP